VWEEYRYNPLGRRVLVRTRGDGGMCDLDAWTCTSSITRSVWEGDNLLWELKAPGADGQNLEATGGSGAAYGQVSYTHAGGIDRPLVIMKSGTSIVTHQNWRGQFSLGTYGVGTSLGQRSDCPPGVSTGCTPIMWPGERTTARHELSKDPNIRNWYGGLVDGMRDASGQMYMRNRYYDPQSGQFTQPDPIGLAGGLNSYGFATGDPVTYSDPYGLCPESLRLVGDKCPGGLSDEQWNSIHQAAETLDDAERSTVIEALAGGAFSAKELTLDRFAQTVWAYDGTSRFELNTQPGASFFELPAADRGYVLSHERGHELQNMGTEDERRFLWSITASQTRRGGAGALGRAYQNHLELDARGHACSHSRSPLFCGP
jgi:RHS repeat-associated protein